MKDADINLQLAEIIANIEQRTDIELISIIKSTLSAVGTGLSINSVNDQYKTVYSELDNRFNVQGFHHQNQFDDLWEFYDYWTTNKLDTYASRRAYIRQLYKDSSQLQTKSETWKAINPTISGVAKSRFDSEHYSDAVGAAFKELNSRIKEEVRQRTGKILDGSDLMNNAFSPKNPIIILDDLGTEDGINIQQGYMLMYSGAMIAIRNPKAHSNDSTEPDEALKLIQIASHLFDKFETAVQRDRQSNVKEDSSHRVLYVRVVSPDDNKKLIEIKRITSNFKGNTSIILVLGSEKRSAIRLPFGVNPSKKLLQELEKILGDENVIYKPS